MNPMTQFGQLAKPEMALTRRQWLRAAMAGALGVASAAALSGCGDGSDDESKSTFTAKQAAASALKLGLVGVATGWLEPGASDMAATSVGVAGLRNQGGASLKADDPLYIGSNGKAMTAMVIAKLVEQGHMAWDWRVADVLPSVAATMRADYAAITLDQWLDHLGGVVPLNGSSDDEERFLAYLQADTEPLPETSHGRRLYVANWVLQQAPVAGIVPGQDFSYSNAGYLIAAAMAEATMGQDFEALLQALLIEPWA